MTGTNQFRTFSEGNSANVISQTDYDALAATIQTNGFSSGLARSDRANKVWRQCCAIAHLIGSFIASKGYDALDNGDPTTLLTNFTNAVSYTPSSAAEGTSGIAAVATQSMTNAGTDDATMVTPKKLRWGFAIQLGVNGYIMFPTWMGGLIVQWCVGNGDAPGYEGVNVVAYPMTFPNNVFWVGVSTDIPTYTVFSDTWYQTVGALASRSNVTVTRQTWNTNDARITTYPRVLAIGN